MQHRDASPDLAVPAVQESDASTCPANYNDAVTIDRLQRALADAEDAQQRAQRLADDGKRFAIATFAERLLPVADNLARAIAAAEGKVGKDAKNSALVVGVRATQRMLIDALAHGGVHRMEALGVHFDPRLHEAVMEDDNPALAPDSVARVLEDGYMLHDRLLRPARVSVARARRLPISKVPEPLADLPPVGTRATSDGKE